MTASVLIVFERTTVLYGLEFSREPLYIGFTDERSPLTSSWPHLRCDVGLEEGEYK